MQLSVTITMCVVPFSTLVRYHLPLSLTGNESQRRVLTHAYKHRSTTWDAITAEIYYINNHTMKWLFSAIVKNLMYRHATSYKHSQVKHCHFYNFIYTRMHSTPFRLVFFSYIYVGFRILVSCIQLFKLLMSIVFFPQ